MLGQLAAGSLSPESYNEWTLEPSDDDLAQALEQERFRPLVAGAASPTAGRALVRRELESPFRR